MPGSHPNRASTSARSTSRPAQYRPRSSETVTTVVDKVNVTDSDVMTDNSGLQTPDLDNTSCVSCIDFYSLRQWNARGFNVRRGEHAQRRNAAGAVFCACQVVARADVRRGEAAMGWVDNAAVYAERSGTYLRPWYEASDTVDRS